MTRGVGARTFDVLAVLGLVGLAVVGLASTFAGWGFLVVAEVAAVLGILLAVATRALPGAVLVALAPIGAVLLGGPVALRSGGLGAGIPDGQTLSDVMTGSFSGWGELLGTLPSVDLSGPPALVPFLLGYGGGVVAGALALRSRSAGGPAVALLGVLVVVLLLRRPDTGLVEWHPVAFAVLAIVWTVARGLELSPERADDVRGEAHGRIRRGLTAAVVVGVALLVAVPLTSGQADTGGRSLLGRSGALPDVTDLDSPLRNFRAYTRQDDAPFDNLNSKTLLTVSGAPAGSRLRFLTLDRYDGRSWVTGNDTMVGTNRDRFLRMDSLVENQTPGRPIRVVVDLAKAYSSAWVPTIGSLTSLRFLLPEATARRPELRYDLATSTAVLPSGVKQDFGYEFTAIVPDQRLRVGMTPWPAPLLNVSYQTSFQPFIDRLVAPEVAPMRKVFLLAKYLRDNGRYSNGSGVGEQVYPSGNDVKRLLSGFVASRHIVGDDEQYAAAMAVLANQVGVPARVVVGAVVPRSGKVRGSDVQAWVEVRISDGSWRTLPTERFMSHRPPQEGMAAVPRPSVPIGGATEPEATPTPPRAARDEPAQDTTDTSGRSVLVRFLPWLVLLLLAVLVPAAKLVRRRLRRTRGRPSDRMAGAWSELVDHARDLGIPVRTRSSRPAQARVMALAGTLPREADDGVFAEEEPTEEAVRAYWQQVLGERRTLGAGRDRWRRLWAPFNPVTFLRRRGSD